MKLLRIHYDIIIHPYFRLYFNMRYLRTIVYRCVHRTKSSATMRILRSIFPNTFYTFCHCLNLFNVPENRPRFSASDNNLFAFVSRCSALGITHTHTHTQMYIREQIHTIEDSLGQETHTNINQFNKGRTDGVKNTLSLKVKCMGKSTNVL